MTRLQKLPQLTSHTERGPTVAFDGQRLTVRYDCRVEEGTPAWTDLVFFEVLTFGYRSMAACFEQDVIGPDYLVEGDPSEERGEAVDRWRTTVGWQEYEKGRQEGTPFKSYLIFFDDAGAIEVIARSLEIIHPSSEG
jgi:hypothetical protein